MVMQNFCYVAIFSLSKSGKFTLTQYEQKVKDAFVKAMEEGPTDIERRDLWATSIFSNRWPLLFTGRIGSWRHLHHQSPYQLILTFITEAEAFQRDGYPADSECVKLDVGDLKGRHPVCLIWKLDLVISTLEGWFSVMNNIANDRGLPALHSLARDACEFLQYLHHPLAAVWRIFHDAQSGWHQSLGFKEGRPPKSPAPKSTKLKAEFWKFYATSHHYQTLFAHSCNLLKEVYTAMDARADGWRTGP